MDCKQSTLNCSFVSYLTLKFAGMKNFVIFGVSLKRSHFMRFLLSRGAGRTDEVAFHVEINFFSNLRVACCWEGQPQRGTSDSDIQISLLRPYLSILACPHVRLYPTSKRLLFLCFGLIGPYTLLGIEP